MVILMGYSIGNNVIMKRNILILGVCILLLVVLINSISDINYLFLGK